MTISEAITQVLSASHIDDHNFRAFLRGDDPEVVEMRQALVQLADAVRGECDHKWDVVDDSFDHEFGCEQIVFQRCELCGQSREYNPPVFDDDVM